MEEEKVIWLEAPLHKNNFPESLINDENILSNLIMSFDGTIMGVNIDKVKDYYLEQKVPMIRAGYQKPPEFSRDIEDEESFYKYVSLFVEL
tara:strand:+ start:7472 stop:7744 length:273 start_codon:yes stop_codon:yes gene_type:complete